jgi:hypothetical protein
MGRAAGGWKEFVTVTDDADRGVVTFRVTGLVCGPLGVQAAGTPGSPAVRTHSYVTDVAFPVCVSVTVHVPDPRTGTRPGPAVCRRRRTGRPPRSDRRV